MKMQAFEENEGALLNEQTDLEEPVSKSSLSKKLERRRRIEDLEEERRLREEMNEF